MNADGETTNQAGVNQQEDPNPDQVKTGAAAAQDEATGMKATGDDRPGPAPDTHPLPPGEMPTLEHYGLEAGAVGATPITGEADNAAQEAEEAEAARQINELGLNNIHNQP